MDSFYTVDELKELGFKKIGTGVKISRKSSVYGASNMEIGNNVRVDDFCILSGKIIVGDYVHVAAYSGLYGGAKGIFLHDFVNISSRNVIYALSDDYSGETMTNPLIPSEYKNVCEEKVELKKHVIVGSGSCILPGVTIAEGVAVGSMSLVNRDLEAWKIYAGIPCRFIKPRKTDLLELEQKMRADRDKV